MKNKIPELLAAAVLLLATQISHAGSAAWNLNPASGNWNTPTNWTPATVPDGAGDTATLEVSNVTDIRLSRWADFDALVFNPGASAFTITASERAYLGLRGAGIVNNSGVTQNIILSDEGGQYSPLFMAGSASAGTDTVFTTRFTEPQSNGFDCYFMENATAGGATINLSGGVWGSGGTNGARLYFFGTSKGGQATIIGNGGEVSLADGAYIWFTTSSTAENATLIANGGRAPNAIGAVMIFDNDASAANANLIANGGVNGGQPGQILLRALGGTARVEVNDNGTLDITGHDSPGVGIGSLEGNGLVYLGNNELTVGSNDRDTTFAGVIGDGSIAGGSLKKVGRSRLLLTQGNTYTGQTKILKGSLMVNNTTGSGTGTGPVQANSGTLSGLGTVAGPVTIGSTASGSGGAIAPGGKSQAHPGTLTIQSALTFNSNGHFNCGLNSNEAAAGRIVANGVTINTIPRIIFVDFGSSILAAGTSFTIIENTTATPIAGSFSNLADGSTVTIGNNTFQANYGGGDGNDLTLTVVP